MTSDTSDPETRVTEIEENPRFTELRRRYRAFVVPATIGFLAWYLLYVVLSGWGRGFMDDKVVGNINVAFVFGLLQFVSTFAIAYAYNRYSARRIDPPADELRKELS